MNGRTEERNKAADPLLERLHNYAKDAASWRDGDTERHPVHGTTLFLARTSVPTRYGDFSGFIFQDLIHKGYVIALVYGEVWSGGELYTRLHSSCVTSETLGGCDCDCVQQLEQAMRVIAERGRGVLFYLLQEGRGVGYCAKARDRMLVQASGETISTFEAYRLLGLRKDYRNYWSIADIIRLLGIDADWVMLTNNPDKVAAMQANGLRVARTEPIEFDPGPFNQFYLRSKRDSGHALERADIAVPRMQLPEQVEPFKPYRLQNVESFIHMASYLLPIQAIDNEVVLPVQQVHDWLGDTRLEAFTGTAGAPIKRYEWLRGNRLAIQMDAEGIRHLAAEEPDHPLLQLRYVPHWFRVHVYFDIVSGDDFVLLTYGKPEAYESPVVRVQSESILNRFPVRFDANKAKYQHAVQRIVRYGSGAIVLVYQDGRGAGFGAFSLDRMLMENGRTRTTEESYRRMGIPFDQRDYTRVFDVLKTHLPNRNIQMIMNSPNSMVQKSEYAQALNASGLNVVNWIFLESEM